MEKKGFKWQIFVEMGLFVLLIVALFLPCVNITADKYLDTAVSVNKYAKKQDKKKADNAGASETIAQIKKGGSERKDSVKEVKASLKKDDLGKMSAFSLAKWSLTVKKDLKYDVVTYKEKNDISKSGVKTYLRLMGVMILLPALIGLIFIILTVIFRKTLAPGMLGTGVVTVLFYFVVNKMLPGMMWGKASSYIVSSKYISEHVLHMKKVGRYAVSTAATNFGSWGTYVIVGIGIVMIIAAVLFMTALKPAREDSENDDWQFDMNNTDIFMNNGQGFSGMQQNNMQGFDGMSNSNMQNFNGMQSGTQMFNGNQMNGGQGVNGMPQKPFVNTQNLEQQYANSVNVNTNVQGKLTGVSGEYAGQEITFQAGEEIVLGRDPRYCTLVYQYPKVSRKHCGIRFDANTGKYQVIDYSSNGTRLSNGGMAMAGSYTTIDPGTVIYLGNTQESIQVG